MKNIRHRRTRRSTYRSDTPARQALKRALLVGIQYTSDEELEGDRANALRGPHNDVFEMRQLLIDYYEYLPENIMILVDTNDPIQTQPTRDNVIHAIKNLVNGAQAGDRFFFHYAGHTAQVENRSNTEEDGLDEYIIPCDGEAKMIKDNELRRHLVDPLPIGSKLVAVFDSCHSASLLDLTHHRCNQVYVPWVSKGKRKSDSRLDILKGNVKRHALVTSPHVHKRKHASYDDVSARHTSVKQSLLSSPGYKSLSISCTGSTANKSGVEAWYGISPIKQCDSPESMWPCDGWCSPESPKEANVIALAACKDDQLSWEDEHGSSMTKALMKILKSDPHPPLLDLLLDISHYYHDMFLRLHEDGQKLRKWVKKINKLRKAQGRPPLDPRAIPLSEVDNFQDPVIASHRPIGREAIWDP